MARTPGREQAPAWGSKYGGLSNSRFKTTTRYSLIRIEQVTHWPRADYGKFYNGDSYIILHTYKKNPSSEVDTHMIVRNYIAGVVGKMIATRWYTTTHVGISVVCLCVQALSWDVHFWIGKYSTQDEYGTAAYKTVELDHFVSYWHGNTRTVSVLLMSDCS